MAESPGAAARSPAPPRYGLVLGGGGARGAAAIGILQVLQEHGIRPAAVAGTSMGALIGAFLAAGWSPGEIADLAVGTRWTEVFDLAGTGGLMKGERFQHWLARHLPGTFAELPVPLVCTATDIDTGELLYLREGDLPSALRATCAFPGAFVPVERDGRHLVDGGLKSTVPVAVIREYPVDVVIACDFQPPLDRPVVGGRQEKSLAWKRFWETLTFQRRNLAADILLKAVDILQTEVCRRQLEDHPPDLLIKPPMPEVNIEDFRLLPRIIEEGAAAARAALADRPDLLPGAGGSPAAPAGTPAGRDPAGADDRPAAS